MRWLPTCVLCLATWYASSPAWAQMNQLRPLPERSWNEQAAVHLMRRAGFEGTPGEVRMLSSMTLEQAVLHLVDYQDLPLAVVDPVLDDALSRRRPNDLLRSLPDDQRQLYRQTRRLAEVQQLERIRAWWLERMLRSPRQLEEKMTLFWHGHFTSGFREVKSSYLLYLQNRLLRRHALGNFRELLLDISTDPCMLLYLDGAKSTKRRPNENYARELLELFTLGEGHYTEADVKEAARAFTGWSLDAAGKFKFRPQQHDYGDKVFLGRVGDWNGGHIIDIILEQKACHRFLVTKLWEFFCYADPEQSVVDGLSATFRKNQFELQPVVRQILMSRGFFSQRSRGRKIKSPVQLAVGTLRLLGIADPDPLQVNRAMSRMGQQLLQPPSVKGWDGGAKWINTATLYNRYNFAGAVVHGYRGDPQKRMMEKMQTGVQRFGFMMPPARRQVGQRPFDPGPQIVDGRLSTAQQVVDFYCGRLLAAPLPADRKSDLVAFLGGSQIDARSREHLQQVQTMIHLLMSTPEYQVY